MARKNKKSKSKKFLLICVTTAVFAIGLFLIFESESKGARVLVVGDMMFDRYVRQVSYNKGGDYIFSCEDSNGITLGDFLKSADLVVGNLEGPITENASRSMYSETGNESNYIFTFPTGTAELLAKNNIKLVSLANNHINNFGEIGIASTKKYLAEAGVEYFGLPANRESLVSEEEIQGHKLSFIAYNEFGTIVAEDVIEKIKEEKLKDQIIIVYAHWGDEYALPPTRVKKLARTFVDAGADIIIGSHPHIVQESENYKDKIIYYSLGNFIFDQYFDEKVSEGLVLELKINNGNISIYKHFISLNRDGRTCLKD